MVPTPGHWCQHGLYHRLTTPTAAYTVPQGAVLSLPPSRDLIFTAAVGLRHACDSSGAPIRASTTVVSVCGRIVKLQQNLEDAARMMEFAISVRCGLMGCLCLETISVFVPLGDPLYSFVICGLPSTPAFKNAELPPLELKRTPFDRHASGVGPIVLLFQSCVGCFGARESSVPSIAPGAGNGYETENWSPSERGMLEGDYRCEIWGMRR